MKPEPPRTVMIRAPRCSHFRLRQHRSSLSSSQLLFERIAARIVRLHPGIRALPLITVRIGWENMNCRTMSGSKPA